MRDKNLRNIPDRKYKWSSLEKYWDLEKIKQGFELFYKEHGRYPTAFEIDDYKYLPSSRQIQRGFGGLKKLRGLLGLDIIDFTRDETRSSSAKLIGRRGKQWEQKLEEDLINHFGELFVHREKFINQINIRPDFVVYAKNKTFAIDIFYPIDIRSLVRSVNIKERVYKNMNLNMNIYFIYANPEIYTQDVDLFLKRKITQLTQNIHLIALETFLVDIQKIEPLKSPLDYKSFYGYIE